MRNVRAITGLFALTVSCAGGLPPADEGAPKPEAALVPGTCARFATNATELPMSSAYPVESSADVCGVSSKNLDAAAAAAGAAVGEKGAQKGAPVAFAAWDHAKWPARLDAVEKRLGLTVADRTTLFTRGFVVLEKHRFATYAEAFHEVFQSELPLWVSMDALFHAVYRSNDRILERLEGRELRTKLNGLLESMHCALAAAASGYTNETAKDVDLYLTIARSLLAGKPMGSIFGVDPVAKSILERAEKAAGVEEIEVFGRRRMVDFSRYAPRGHYEGELAGYYRAVTFLSQFELNLVTRDCASSSSALRDHTPREATAAVALAALVEKSGATAALDALEKTWSALAGKREDVSFVQLGKIARDAKIDNLKTDAMFEQLRKAIAGPPPVFSTTKQYLRTVRTHFTAEGCSELPVIATMLGPRIVPDAAIAKRLVNPDVPGRQLLGPIDMAFALGHKRAAIHMAPEQAKYPTLAAALGKAHVAASAPLGDDLYSAWFGAIRALADEPAGTLPTFMRKDAFRDLRIGSTIAAYGQLRHNFGLMAAQAYGEAGCAIPDAFVEPAPAVLDGLIQYAARGEAVLKTLGVQGPDVAYFQRLGKSLSLLRAFVGRELDNRPLPEEATRFLSMVVESRFGDRGTGGAPSFTGWYFDLFANPEEALDPAAFLADFYTSTELSEAAYAGVKSVLLGVFVVDAGGEPRVVVGPVADAFAAHEKLPRLGDAAISKVTADAPWARSYTAAGPDAPPLALSAKRTPKKGFADSITVKVWSTQALGKVTVELLDHHRRPLGAQTVAVTDKPIELVFPGKALKKDAAPEPVQGLHVKFGDWHAFDTGAMTLLFGHAPLFAVDEIGRAWGGMKAPESKTLKQATGE